MASNVSVCSRRCYQEVLGFGMVRAGSFICMTSKLLALRPAYAMASSGDVPSVDLKAEVFPRRGGDYPPVRESQFGSLHRIDVG